MAYSSYTIQIGDTLSQIAQNNSLSLELLLDLNPQILRPNHIQVGEVIILPKVKETDPIWLKIAFKELGVSEAKKPKNNHRILEYFQATRFLASNDSTDWCSAFVNWVMVKAQQTPTYSVVARKWMHWEHGDHITISQRGAITVFWREHPSSWKGHVGFFLEKTDTGDIMILGGNQNSKVSIAAYSKERLLGYVWPKNL